MNIEEVVILNVCPIETGLYGKLHLRSWKGNLLQQAGVDSVPLVPFGVCWSSKLHINCGAMEEMLVKSSVFRALNSSIYNSIGDTKFARELLDVFHYLWLKRHMPLLFIINLVDFVCWRFNNVCVSSLKHLYYWDALCLHLLDSFFLKKFQRFASLLFELKF